MSGFSVQFHALPSEIKLLMGNLIDDNNVFITCIRRNPSSSFRSEIILHLWDRDVSVDFGILKGIAFTMESPDLASKTIREFNEKNMSSLILEIGDLSPLGLNESWIYTSATDKDILRRWRKARKLLLDQLLSGAEAVNPDTHETAPMKWHRFSEGTRKAFMNGTRILPPGGKSIIRIN